MTNERKEMIQKQFTNLVNDEFFCKALAQQSTAEGVSTLLATYGVAMTADEVNELTREGLDNIARYGAVAEDELTEDDLDAVVGGGKFWRAVGAVVGAVALGGTLGLISGACPAFTPVAYKIGAGYSLIAGTWVAAG